MQSQAKFANETFIPCSRKALVSLILQDGRLSPADVEIFSKFSSLLSAYYHFQFHSILETIKESYAPFNPNQDPGRNQEITMDQRNQNETQVIENFRKILDKANFQELSLDKLKQAISERSLVALNTEVNFDEFKHLICFYRGESEQTMMTRQFFRKCEQEFEVFNRVVLLIQYKDESYFEEQGLEVNELNFSPGQIYLYFYKDVPKQDLELLFPNVSTQMTLKDKLMLAVPATGMGVIVLIRILPQLLLVLGVLLFIFEAPSALNTLKASESESRNLMPVLVSTFSLAIALGGFGFKQYSNYNSKRIKFQKKVTETLFFRNIANHSAVFQIFIDVAEEEECKEVLLAYYLLLTAQQPLNQQTLDHACEAWLQTKLGEIVNFDVEDAIQKLRGLEGDSAEQASQLLTEEANGALKVLPIEQAYRLLDGLWDDAFNFDDLQLNHGAVKP